MSKLYNAMKNAVAKNVFLRIQAIHLSEEHCTKNVYAATVCECANWAVTKMGDTKITDKEYYAIWKLWDRSAKFLENKPLSEICSRSVVTGRWFVREPESIFRLAHLHLSGKDVSKFPQTKTADQ